MEEREWGTCVLFLPYTYTHVTSKLEAAEGFLTFSWYGVSDDSWDSEWYGDKPFRKLLKSLWLEC